MMSFRFLLFAIVGLFCLHPLAGHSDPGGDWRAAQAREMCIAKAELAADIAAYRDEGKTYEAVRTALVEAGVRADLAFEHIVEWVMLARAIYSSTVTPAEVFRDIRRACFDGAGITDA